MHYRKDGVMEDKEKICKHLFEALQLTREFSNLLMLKYTRTGDFSEVVTAKFTDNATKTINVSMDSGFAMMMDIMKGLGR